MNLIGGTLTLVFSLIVLGASRRWAILAVMAATCYITQGQVVDVGGFHFTSIRLVLLVGFVRGLARGEFQLIRMNPIDRTLIGLAIVSTVLPGIRTGYWQEVVGGAYNTLLSYFVFRTLVTSLEDAEALFDGMALLIIPLAMCMMLESATGTNVFDFMGGHDEATMREGRFRCVGSFRGPHTAGTFGAVLVPMFVGFFFINRRRPVVAAGLIAATIMTYTSNASGPLMAYLSALVGLGFWRLRLRMKQVRQGIVIMLVILGFTMKAPIWYIMAKISALTGGDGWYRSYLMEQCWKHMSSWWLMGTSDTAEWAATLMSWGGADLCNLYVSMAATSGMAGLILIILLLVLCFRYLGRALAVARESAIGTEVFLWCLGSALFAHVMTLFSVTYFDQLHVAWWGLLAIISSVTSDVLQRSPSPSSELVAEDTSSLPLEPVPSEDPFPQA